MYHPLYCFSSTGIPFQRAPKECWYFMRQGHEFNREDITKESMALKASSNVDSDLRNALIDEESGILRAGLLPQVHTATSAGAKNLLSSITQAGRSKSDWGMGSYNLL